MNSLGEKVCSRFKAELHLVHYKATFADLGEALKSGDEDALAVLGFFVNTQRSGTQLPVPN